MHTGASCKNATDQAIDAAIDAYETQMGFGVLFSIVASTVSQTSTWNMYLPRPVTLTFRILLVYSGARALEIRGSVVRAKSGNIFMGNYNLLKSSSSNFRSNLLQSLIYLF
ncbi:hypothetical protein TWF225_008083 [Orbilia oligospora]|nr:hypothetical protein TWF225_008083 [Orbilia oligospora]KAF3247973.1 hypothetical protein TWF217_009435 [Orbilia oligospora]